MTPETHGTSVCVDTPQATYPEDVLQAAADAVMSMALEHVSTAHVQAVARAIFAERERCAKVAEMFRISICDEDYDLGATDTAENIADAIRKGGRT